MTGLGSLVAWAVRRRGVVLVVSAIVVVTALATLRKLAIDAVPDVTNVQVTVITSSPGLSPAEVESYLTFPVEMAMNGLPELDEIRSISRTAVPRIMRFRCACSRFRSSSSFGRGVKTASGSSRTRIT